MEIQDLKVENYPDFLTLYNESFPADQRRPFKSVDELSNFIKMKGGKFHAFAAKDGDIFLGFLSYWIFERYAYVEHFAVTEPNRGKNIGREMLNHLFKTVSPNVLLEVEKPLTNKAIGVITFYQKNGFSIRKELNYVQPPYTDESNAVDMLLMTHGNVSLHDYRDLEPMLREVYNLRTLI